MNNKLNGVLIGLVITVAVIFTAWCLGTTEFRL